MGRLAVNYFGKTLRFRHLTGFWRNLWVWSSKLWFKLHYSRHLQFLKEVTAVRSPFFLFLLINLTWRSSAYLHEFQQNTTASRLSRASDANTFLKSCSSSAIFSSESLIKTESSDCKIFVKLFSRHSCRQSTYVGSTVSSNVIVSGSKSIHSSSVVSLEICANNSWKSVSISSFMMVSVNTLFQSIWSQLIAFNTQIFQLFEKLFSLYRYN